MRIRQIKPEFWADPDIGRWSADTQTFYQRLWNIADDVGWLEWEPDVIGALTYPYRAAASRVRHIEKQSGVIYGKWLVIYECRCAHLPKLELHQRITGKKSIRAFQRHQEHRGAKQVAPRDYLPLTGKHTVVEKVSGKGTGTGKGKVGNVSAQARENGLSTEGATT